MNKIQINQIKMELNHSIDDLKRKIAKLVRIDINNIISLKIIKKSIDARNKRNIFIVYSVVIEINKKIKTSDNNIVMLTREADEYKIEIKNTSQNVNIRPVIVGSGPAGLFCGLVLSEYGFKPIILERGKDVDSRIIDIKNFFDTGLLNENSNIQFGEGGAGTFSDGKINTLVNDKKLRNRKVIKEFVLAGAPEEIEYINKPHIGTDYLVNVVKNMRKKIECLGGEIRFNSKVSDIVIKNNKAVGVTINDNEILESDIIVIAIGHSARDTFSMLSKKNLFMECKDFAIGLRIEHPQEIISINQYGNNYKNKNLPIADYKLTYKASTGRNVYSFCMCPGGFVVNSSSEKGHLVCNGMSNFYRDERNANSAIIVNVSSKDFGSDDVLAGVEFQKIWEEKAFIAGGSDYSLPVQLFSDFEKNTKSTIMGDVLPNIKGNYTFGNLNEVLPFEVVYSLKEGINNFGNKIRGFNRPDAILTGVETRTSSPVRIVRNDDFQSNIEGLYPCGEGAGYAGGIMSAAMDGIKIAEAIIEKVKVY